jgi:hypothetical protein
MKNPNVFPGTEEHWYNETKIGETYHHGMKLRDYFAGQALAGMISNGGRPSDLAKDAYSVADKMLKERENETR